MKEDGAHSGHSRAAGLALVDVRAARDSGEPVERGRTKSAFLCWGNDHSFWMVDVDPGPGEAASGFKYWGGAVGAVGYFAGVQVRFEKHVGGWLVSGLAPCCVFVVSGDVSIWHATGRENMDQSCLTCEYLLTYHLDTSFLHVKLVGPPQSGLSVDLYFMSALREGR